MAVPRHSLTPLVLLINSAVFIDYFSPRAALQQREGNIAGCWVAGGPGGCQDVQVVCSQCRQGWGCASPHPRRRSGVLVLVGKAGQGCRRALGLPQMGEGGSMLSTLQPLQAACPPGFRLIPSQIERPQCFAQSTLRHERAPVFWN